MVRERSACRRLPRRRIALRWLGLLVLLAVAVAYVRPLRAYQHARSQVASAQRDVAALEAANRGLRHRLARTDTDQFALEEARKLGLVRPGERLFIVKVAEKPKEARIR